MHSYEIAICLWLAMFGACTGSFINVVVYRTPRQDTSFVKGRSRCPSCNGMLRWYDLFPIISWFILGGRCRFCRKPISPRYPIVETLCAAIAPLCYLRWGFDYRTPFVFGVCVILLAVALIDHDVMEIPNGLILALIPFAAAEVWLWRDITLLERAIGFVVVSVPLLIITLAVSGAFGGGDIKLMAVCGFLLGYKNTLLAFMVALLLGGGYAAFLMATKRSKRGSHIAFGPYLCIGVVTALFFGKQLIRAYLGLFGL